MGMEALKAAVQSKTPIFLGLRRSFGMPKSLVLKREGYLKRHPNTPLRKAMHEVCHPGGNPDYYRHDVWSAQDVLRAMQVIKNLGGHRGLQNTRIAYQGFVMTMDEFFIKSDGQKKNLINTLYNTARMRDIAYCVDTPNERRAYGTPRLWHFNPLSDIKKNPFAPFPLRTPVTDATETLIHSERFRENWASPNDDWWKRSPPKNLGRVASQIQMRTVIDAENSEIIPRHHFAAAVFVLAVPMVYSNEISQAINKAARFGQQQAYFVTMHLCVTGNGQVTPVRDFNHFVTRKGRRDYEPRQMTMRL
jgi:hypothetical protein